MRRRDSKWRWVGSLLVFTSGHVYAQEEVITLKEGPGKEHVVHHCTVCHSLDYIPMNSPFLDRKGWKTTVNKMIKVMGARIPQKDMPVIIDYLSLQYGK